MFSIPPSYQAEFISILITLVALLMATNKVRYDLIAIGVVLTLLLTDILTTSQALAGFSNSVVIVIAGLLIIGDMLERTGVAQLVGDWILSQGGKSMLRLTAMIMLASAFLSAIMSSTAVAAIFIPIIIRVARKTMTNPAALLLPMSYAALVSGMLTLIATPPNLVISESLQSAGFQPLGFFSFSLLGLLVLLLTLAFMLLIGRHWLPSAPISDTSEAYQRPIDALWDEYRVQRQLLYLQVGPHSPLNGQSIGQSKLYEKYGIRVLTLGRIPGTRSALIAAPNSSQILHTGDILYVAVQPELLDNAIADFQLTRYQATKLDGQYRAWELGAVTVLIHPNSRLQGKSLREAQFRTHYGVDVFGLKRKKEVIGDIEDTPLAHSDSLLIIGPWRKIKQLQAQNHDFVVLETPQEALEVAPSYQKMPHAFLITAAMVTMALFDWVPLVAAVLLSAVAAVLSRCLTAADAYRAIHWQTLILLGGMLPLADALAVTGVTDNIAQLLFDSFGSSSPEVMLTVLFFVTIVLTNILSNTASAVLMAPLAISAAQLIGVSPYPLAITVVFAASSAFLTPVASPVVTLIVAPGKYRLIDFLKLGTPLVFVVYGVCYWGVPLLFPW
jgi:di/tricarboxylate transporter